MGHSQNLLPNVGTWVSIPGKKEPGIVTAIGTNLNIPTFNIKWLKSNKTQTHHLQELRCGFPLGIEVQDIPVSRTRPPLGEGIVREVRCLGGKDQVLVEFPERGEMHWMPYENLRQIKGVRQRFELGQNGESGNAERFRLRSLAYAIEMWQENTGSLSRLDIDPLPHQIHLVHHILASGNMNWFIADDVGLGKTIEVGMLLSALLKRGTFRRILLVTPAGLVNQWKEELHHKFGLSDFQVYGEDFHVSEPRHWKLHDFVIGSMDRLKGESHLTSLMQADPWDLIVFDEAHRLSRIQSGMSFKSSDRFRLAATLRKKTDSLLLLSATPHQGKQDKFQALLELIRPEAQKQIRTLSLNPEILRHMVIRNNKSEATDENGNFIFQGKITSSIEVPTNTEGKEFDEKLYKYLREGYSAGSKKGGSKGRAIGFVMSIYRKLAASSIAAIEKSLMRRLKKLKSDSFHNFIDPNDIDFIDERFIGEWEEKFDGTTAPFFEGEISLLVELIKQAKKLLNDDQKIQTFLDELIPSILKNNPEEKVLIFTEYRASLGYIAEALRSRFGSNSVALIHGGLTHVERERAIAEFEDTGQFLISTEAGGEGINLHRECHIMVNYDLPWNPMRLVQRVGRLYRYGQKHKAVVFNMHSSHTLDGEIIKLLYKKIDQVVRDMSVLGGEFKPGFEAEILGEISEVIEVEKILEKAAQETASRTQENIEEAIQRAKEAVEKHRELLEFAAGFDPDETKEELKITLDHVRAFVNGSLSLLNVEVLETSHNEQVFKIKLPEEIVEELALRGQQMRITLNRDIAGRRKDIHMMDLDSPLFNYMLSHAKDYCFDGRVAKLSGLDASAVVTSILRWQNDQGIRMRQEFIAMLVDKDGEAVSNPEEILEWLKKPASDGIHDSERTSLKNYMDSALSGMDRRLGEVSNVDLHPENHQLISAGCVSSASAEISVLIE